jgi:SAM-dependent methyltransferase
MLGAVNVDAFAICEPDVVWNLNDTPWTWAADNSFSLVHAHHVIEHLERDKWWNAFKEIGRILMPGGLLDMRVPDASSKTALTYRDHNSVFSIMSFHGIHGTRGFTNAWAAEQESDRIPLGLVLYQQVPFTKYNWMRHFPWMLRFCAEHMTNFIWEQRFIFQKRQPDREGENHG